MKRYVVPALSDLHVHFRQGEMMDAVAPHSAAQCGRVLAMPNTIPPVADAAGAAAYGLRLRQRLPGVDVLVAAKLMPQTTPDQVLEARAAGSVAAWKLYPGGATTHSDDGIPGEALAQPHRHTWLGDLLDAMDRSRTVLCLHGELPQEEDPLLREPGFLPFAAWVLSTFPRLRVVLEHVTTASAVDFVRSRAAAGAKVAATITAHHLYLHLGHLLGTAALDPLGGTGDSRLALPAGGRDGPGDGKLHPHHFCWPVAKQPPHRQALREAALSGLPCFFLGSDSAPHPREAKESGCGCAGIYTASVLAEALAGFFFRHDALDRMPSFVAHFGDRFYGRAGTGRMLALEDDPWTVPASVAGGRLVPLFAGKSLRWRAAPA